LTTNVVDLGFGIIVIISSAAYVQQIAELLNIKATDEAQSISQIQAREIQAISQIQARENSQRSSGREKMPVRCGVHWQEVAEIRELSFTFQRENIPLSLLGKDHPCFTDFNMYHYLDGAAGLHCTSLPQGGIIGVRQLHSVAENSLELLFRLLASNQLLPQHGICKLLSCRNVLVLGDKYLGIYFGTLWENLIYGSAFDSPDNKVAKTESFRNLVWKMCKVLGLSPRLLGSAPDSGWEDSLVRIEPHMLETKERAKVGVIRAILSEPDVLFIEGIGDSWSAPEQTALARLLDGWHSGAIHEALRDARGTAEIISEGAQSSFSQEEKHLSSFGRTMFVAADNNLFCQVIRVGFMSSDDMVLTIESSSRGTLQTAGQVYPQAFAGRNVNSMMEYLTGQSSQQPFTSLDTFSTSDSSAPVSPHVNHKRSVC